MGAILITAPVRSPAYRNGSQGQQCTFEIPGVCNHNTETTVFCHLRDEHAGGAQKSSDLSGADGCFACHDVMDRRARMPNGQHISEADWNFYALRALQRTLDRRYHQEILQLPGKAARDKPKRERKPREKADKPPSRPIRNGKARFPTGRKFPKAGKRQP